jgi:hypothetical protein
VIRERRSANTREIHAHDAMLANISGARNSPRGIELSGMPLTILDGQRITLEPLLTGNRQRSRRIQPTG